MTKLHLWVKSTSPNLVYFIMKTLSKVVLIVLFILFVWLANAFGQTTTQLESFDEVSVTGNLEVVLTKGDVEQAELHVKGIPADKITIRVDRGNLKLRLLNSVFYKNDKAIVYVTYKKLNVIRGQAGAIIYSKAPVVAESLEFVANSGADLDFEVESESVEASASEGANLELSGVTNRHRAKAVTGGQYEARSLKADIVYARAGTGGFVEVNAEKSLEASVNTGGVIEYSGNPETSIKKLLGGEVRRR